MHRRNLSRHRKIFLQKRLSHKGYPLYAGRTIFGQVFGRGAVTKNLKIESPPPYRGPSALQSARIIGARLGSPISRCQTGRARADRTRSSGVAMLPSFQFALKCITYTVGDAQARFSRMKSTSKKRTPSIVNLTVKRRYLTQREIDRLMDCARKHGRYGHRDATMILVAYRHGLRASEVCDLKWQQIELSEGRLHVHRVKNGIPSVHPIRGNEMRALRKLRRDYLTDAHIFVSERGGPISPIGFHRLV